MTHRCRKHLLIGLLLVVSVRAQDIPDRAIHYRPGDWISYKVHRFVTSITLDHQYVYFGTTQGISRYDFYRQAWDTPFTYSDGMADDVIHLVFYDFNSGYLWCVTDAGLSCRIPAAEEWRNYSYDDLGFGLVTGLGSGNTSLWVRSGDQIYRGDIFGGFFREMSLEEAEEDAVNWNNSRFVENLPELFMEGGDFLYPDERIVQRTDLRQYSVTDSFQDAYQNLWMGTWGLGGALADMSTRWMRLLPFGPAVSDIRALCWDETGMWIGGSPGHGDEESGITRWDRSTDQWTYFEAPYLTRLHSDNVRAMAADTRYVWIGTDNGLSRYDPSKDVWLTFGVYDNLWNERINAIAISDGCVWVGTDLGINRIKPELVIEKEKGEGLIHCKILRLAGDGPDVWAATERGIYHYSGADSAWRWIQGAGNILAREVTAVSVWAQEVWFGTDDGVQVYDKTNGAWKGYPSAHYPTGGMIHTILANDSLVWFGTDDGVLKFVKSENRWHRYSIHDGLPDASIYRILADGDYLWFGTGRGLTRFYWNAPYRVD